MSQATPADVQRLLAAAFDEQGWEYGLEVGTRLRSALENQSVPDSIKLARSLPATFLDRNSVSRDRVANVIDRALRGATLKEEKRQPTTIVIGGNNYQFNLGDGASVVDSNINIGEGAHLVVTQETERKDVLVAVEALLRAGLAGEWNDAAARELGALVEGRPDIDFQEIQSVAVAVAKDESPRRERLNAFLGHVASSGIGGALAVGLTSGIGEALTHIPL